LTVIRCAGNPESAFQWDADTYIAQTGLLEDFTIEAETISLTCVPVPMHTALKLPRLWYSRTCQHALYGPVCQAVKASFKQTGQIHLAESTARRREIQVDGVSGAQTDTDHFTSGTLVHVDTGEEFTIYQSTYTSGTTTLTARLGHWSEAFEDDDEVELYPGCRRTVEDCETKFSNKINFGGFPYIPNRNPTIDSSA
jgi:Uncharacterized conserved protein